LLPQNCKLSDFETLFYNEGIERSRYELTTHHVTTEDGFVLEMFRVHLTPMEMFKTMKHRNFNKKIMLMHEFAGSADSAFYNGNNSVGFHLVDQGFDVWLPNNRGNKYSSQSLKDGMSEDKFYDYSFAEMGKYDIPALYKYILEEYHGGIYKNKKITFIGYSQGTSQMFSGLLEEKSGNWLAQRTEKFVAIAPIVYLNHAASWVYKGIAKVLIGQRIYQFTNKLFGSYQSLPTMCRSKIAMAHVATEFCNMNWLFKKICQNIIPGVSIDPRFDNILENFKKLSEYYPSGSSAKSLIHLAQLMILDKSGYEFQDFDYGESGNIERYGSKRAPQWDVTKISTDVVIINGTEDFLANREDVEKLNDDLNLNGKSKLHWIEGWNHITNLFAKNGKPLFDLLDSELMTDSKK